MKNIKLDLIKLLTSELTDIFSKKTGRSIKADLKSDHSVVTEIDLLVSNYFKDKLSQHPTYVNYNFFSEEDLSTFRFPCAVIDPIDGTRELSKGRGECAVSMALMKTEMIDDPNNYAWIYNPFTGFSIDSDDRFVHAVDFSQFKISGMASRSEFHKGLFAEIKNDKIVVFPRGSIAFKLGLLASGACDFIVSKNPKNVWDIAAGTIICAKRGYHFYENGKKIDKLDRERYHGTLIWAHESHAEELFKEFLK